MPGGEKVLEVYIKNGCPYCEKQLQVLNREGKEYRLYNVSSDQSALKKARNELKADRVPILVESGSVRSIGFGGGG